MNYFLPWVNRVISLKCGGNANVTAKIHNRTIPFISQTSSKRRVTMKCVNLIQILVFYSTLDSKPQILHLIFWLVCCFVPHLIHRLQHLWHHNRQSICCLEKRNLHSKHTEKRMEDSDFQICSCTHFSTKYVLRNTWFGTNLVNRGLCPQSHKFPKLICQNHQKMPVEGIKDNVSWGSKRTPTHLGFWWENILVCLIMTDRLLQCFLLLRSIKTQSGANFTRRGNSYFDSIWTHQEV